MAERHDRLVAHYRARLAGQGFKIEGHSPFVDYRPDIFGTKHGVKLFVEAEIEATLESPHTLHQLDIMHTYLTHNGKTRGVLLVPRGVESQARFLLHSVFGDKRIRVVSL